MPRPRSQRTIFALLLGTLALIGYGSLYPFDLKPSAHSISVWQALGDLTWARSGRGDRVANVLLYIPLGFCLFLWVNARTSRWVATVFAILFGTVFSYGIEVTQVFIAQRVSSYWDVVFNCIGSVIGAAAGIAWYELSGRLRAAQNSSTDRGAIVLVLLWLIWRLWPFIPQFSIGRLKGAFQPLADPYFPASSIAHYLIWWT